VASNNGNSLGDFYVITTRSRDFGISDSEEKKQHFDEALAALVDRNTNLTALHYLFDILSRDTYQVIPLDRLVMER
tara:strand:- start:3281 stop:3508 length:228 start_codon:yes stop_codon:yes gene_type:complete